jgi:hypothetical protein
LIKSQSQDQINQKANKLQDETRKSSLRRIAS